MNKIVSVDDEEVDNGGAIPLKDNVDIRTVYPL